MIEEIRRDERQWLQLRRGSPLFFTKTPFHSIISPNKGRNPRQDQVNIQLRVTHCRESCSRYTGMWLGWWTGWLVLDCLQAAAFETVGTTPGPSARKYLGPQKRQTLPIRPTLRRDGRDLRCQGLSTGLQYDK
ncbi:MAG: hypothetical protein R6X31_13745 [Anaerolineae bacterium]